MLKHELHELVSADEWVKKIGLTVGQSDFFMWSTIVWFIPRRRDYWGRCCPRGRDCLVDYHKVIEAAESALPACRACYIVSFS